MASFREFSNALDILFTKCKSLLTSKGQDYSDKDNTFVNFETSATVAGTTREQSCMVLIGTKCSRLRELLIKAKEPNHESVEDTIVDLACYVALLYGMVQENNAAAQVVIPKPPHYDPCDASLYACKSVEVDYDMRSKNAKYQRG